MNGYQYILTKQTEWAKNQGIKLIGSKGDRGKPSYTTVTNENLFQPLLPVTRKAFDEGDGDELSSKMRAVHSSSALGVNVFQYWKKNDQIPVIAAACGFCKSGAQISKDIIFEDKQYQINDSFSHHPNIDVVIHNDPSTDVLRFAIECKFSEAYGGRKHGGLKKKYISCGDLWKDMPEMYRLAKSISPEDEDFKYLHPAQLMKHILGLKRQFGRDGFRLLYLWYDVLGEDGKGHGDEVAEFASVAKRDGVKFHALTYQELIAKLSREQRNEHGEYVHYLTERYL